MYHFIHRYGRSFNHNDVRWIYSCTCDASRARFVASLNVFVNCCYEDFDSMHQFPECIHIQATLSIVTELDAVNCITPAVDLMGMLILYILVCIVLCPVCTADHSYASGSVENPFEVTRLHPYFIFLLSPHNHALYGYHVIPYVQLLLFI